MRRGRGHRSSRDRRGLHGDGRLLRLRRRRRRRQWTLGCWLLLRRIEVVVMCWCRWLRAVIGRWRRCGRGAGGEGGRRRRRRGQSGRRQGVRVASQPLERFLEHELRIREMRYYGHFMQTMRLMFAHWVDYSLRLPGMTTPDFACCPPAAVRTGRVLASLALGDARSTTCCVCACVRSESAIVLGAQFCGSFSYCIVRRASVSSRTDVNDDAWRGREAASSGGGGVAVSQNLLKSRCAMCACISVMVG